jgi:hypothetical protein
VKESTSGIVPGRRRHVDLGHVDLVNQSRHSVEGGHPGEVRALRSVLATPTHGRARGPGRRERRERMSKGLRTFLIVVVVAVLLFFVITQPVGAADVVQSILTIIGNALSSIATFFRSLF